MRLFSLLLLAIFTIWPDSQPPFPTPLASASVDHKKAEPKQEKADSNQKSTEDLVTAIDHLTSEIAEWNQQQTDTKNKNEPPIEWWAKANTIAVTLFTGALAVLAFLQWRAMHRQADIYDRQVLISEKQADIAQAAQRQWVNLDNWQVWIDKKISNFRIRFQVVNPTNLPLQLELIDTTTELLDCDADPHLENFPLSESLAPTNPFITDITIPLSTTQIDTLIGLQDSSAMSLHLACVVDFTDCSTKRWEQYFERAIFFSKGDLFALKGHDSLIPSIRDFKNSLRER